MDNDLNKETIKNETIKNDNKNNDNLGTFMETVENVNNIEHIQNNEFINNIVTEKNSKKTYPNKFIKFVDKHYIGISALLGCFYMTTVIWVWISYAYNSNELLNILYAAYVAVFIAYILLYIGMTIAYKDTKYILSIILGFIIGFFTCGGLFFVVMRLY